MARMSIQNSLCLGVYPGTLFVNFIGKILTIIIIIIIIVIIVIAIIFNNFNMKYLMA